MPKTENAPENRDTKIVPVIAIASSSESFDSLDRLFASMSANVGAAFVVVTPHGSPALPDRIVKSVTASGLEALAAEDGIKLSPNKVYVASRDGILTVRGGHLHIEAAQQVPGHRAAIDSFLISLADDLQEYTVAIVLAGIDGDGTIGLMTVREAGGLTIAEGTETPPSNVANPTGTADFVLPVERIAEKAFSYIQTLKRFDAKDEISFLGENASANIARIAAILHTKTGHDFHGYKQNTFARRVQRRMQVVQAETVERYVEILRSEGNEAAHLFQDLLIGVTEFFRDPKEFELLEKEIIPKLFEGKATGDQLRVWVLGCATGEEAYSIAILLRECMAKLDVVPHVQIFATDIDGRALATARVGRYPETISRNVTPERLSRWFMREGNTYCVAKELREMCIFSAHNLIKDAPFSRVDLISCRNLLIYLNSDLQNRVLPLFHFALKPGGYLFLGPSESVTRHAKLFSPVDRRHRIFKRVESASRILPEFPLSSRADKPKIDGENVPALRPRSLEPTLAKRAERIAERYSPAYVVIDEQYEVLHFSGRTGRYLDPATGSANLNLLNLVHRDLRLDLRAAVHKALVERMLVKAQDIQMGSNGTQTNVNIVVEPIDRSPASPVALAVIFQEAGSSSKLEAESDISPQFLRDEHIQRLDAELRLTKERLQATIEELESTNEELKSSNEEYQSINEELQSANEELETSKEELQSVNEELQTVNGELGHRVHDLGRANSDLKNLFEGTQIATIFLDNDLNIKNFTPTITDIFNLIETDLGRPIVHITQRITYPDLEEDVRKVSRTLGTIEREVENPTGERYLVRVLPYRSIDNFIAGVVLTFLDVTATARAEKALQESEERFRRMAHAVPAILFTAAGDMSWDYVNPRFSQFTGLSESAAMGTGWLAVMHPDDVQIHHSARAAAIERGEPFQQEFRLRSERGGYRWFMGLAEPVIDKSGKASRWFGSVFDTHERKLAENRQNLLLAELQHRVKNVLSVVKSIAARTVQSAADLTHFSSHFEGRLSALARTQNVLSRTPDVAVDLEELVREELLADAAGEDGRITISGPTVSLGQKTAEAMGLALHELTTNAVKYGALAVPNGKISINWSVRRASAPRLSFEWVETNVPLVDTVPSRSGFGRELIERGLPYELGATTALEFRPGGIRCVIEMPLEEPQDSKDMLDDEA